MAIRKCTVCYTKIEDGEPDLLPKEGKNQYPVCKRCYECWTRRVPSQSGTDWIDSAGGVV